jgi:hypothetical protein
MNHVAELPQLAFCAEEIFYDNGMCNRFAPPVAAQVVSALVRVVEKFGEDKVKNIESVLAGLHRDDLQELCTNSHEWWPNHQLGFAEGGDPVTPWKADIEAILDEIFEES